MKACRRCKNNYKPTESQLRKHNWLCSACSSIENKEYRAKCKAVGRPLKHAKCSEAWWKIYRAKYYADPINRKRRAENMRRYQSKSNPTLRIRHEARWQVNRAIIAKRLHRKPCEKCGIVKVEAHHADYSKPLEVNWLCRSCHRTEHAKARGEG